VDNDVTDDDAALWCELFQMLQINVSSSFSRSKKSSPGHCNLIFFLSKRKYVFNDTKATHTSRQYHIIFDHWFCRCYISKTDRSNYNKKLKEKHVEKC